MEVAHQYLELGQQSEQAQRSTSHSLHYCEMYCISIYTMGMKKDTEHAEWRLLTGGQNSPVERILENKGKNGCLIFLANYLLVQTTVSTRKMRTGLWRWSTPFLTGSLKISGLLFLRLFMGRTHRRRLWWGSEKGSGIPPYSGATMTTEAVFNALTTTKRLTVHAYLIRTRKMVMMHLMAGSCWTS